MLDWFIEFANTYLVKFTLETVLAIAVLFIGLKIVKILMAHLHRHKLFQNLDSNIGTLILNVLRILLNALVIIATIQILGVPSATIIAAIGSCGLAIGLALQGGLSNLAGGVMIMIFKPFHSGDFIFTKEGDGFVEEIGIFYTKLNTIDHRSINIPNSILSSTTVTNLYATDIQGIEIDLSVAYGTDIARARQALLTCAQENPLVLKDPAPKVLVTAHGDSSIKLILRAFGRSKDYFQLRPELMEASLSAITDAGLEIPFPQVDVHMKND